MFLEIHGKKVESFIKTLWQGRQNSIFRVQGIIFSQNIFLKNFFSNNDCFSE